MVARASHRPGSPAAAPALSAAVMTHPARLPAAREVAAALAPLDARVAVDPDPEAGPSTIRSARLAYAAVADDATHHLVVQDDVWLPPGFAAAARQAIAQQPDAAISFFVEWGSRTAALVRFAALTGASWAPMVNPYVPTQALAMPGAVAKDLATFLLTEVDVDDVDDEAALRFLRRAGVPTLVSVPNLVEHADESSLVGNNDHGVRRATCLMPGAPPPLGADVVDVPELLPFLAWVDGTATTIDTVDGSYSVRRATGEVLAEWGHDAGSVSAAYRSALAALADGEALRTAVGDRHLVALWETAVATGVVLRTRWPATAGRLPERLADPLVHQALRTMGPGALRTFVDFDVLTGRADALADLVAAGLRHGAAAR
jgi:hypothetical protein